MTKFESVHYLHSANRFGTDALQAFKICLDHRILLSISRLHVIWLRSNRWIPFDTCGQVRSRQWFWENKLNDVLNAIFVSYYCTSINCGANFVAHLISMIELTVKSVLPSLLKVISKLWHVVFLQNKNWEEGHNIPQAQHGLINMYITHFPSCRIKPEAKAYGLVSDW